MKIKQLHADKKESFSLAVELDNGLTVSLSDYLRALHARIEKLEEQARPVQPLAADSQALKDCDIAEHR